MSNRSAIRRRPALFTVVVLTLSVTGCGVSEPIVLGASAGDSFLFSARLALEDELSKGPFPDFDTTLIAGGTNRSQPAIEAAIRLASVPGMVAVVGHSNSAASLATAPIYNEHEVVQLAPTTTAVAYSDAGPYSFRMVPPDDVQGAFLADLLAEAFAEGARVALLYVNDDYGQGLRRAFLQNVEQELHPVVLELPHVEGEVEDVDVRHAADILGAADPDVILWLGRSFVLHRHLPAIRRTLGDVPIVGSDALSSAVRYPNETGYWDGIRYLDFLDLERTAALRRFRRRYRERFGTEAVGPEVLTYDAMCLLIAGIRAGVRSGEEMREYLVSLGSARPPFEGLSGPVTFNENGDIQRTYVVETIGRGGGP